MYILVELDMTQTYVRIWNIQGATYYNITVSLKKGFIANQNSEGCKESKKKKKNHLFYNNIIRLFKVSFVKVSA